MRLWCGACRRVWRRCAGLSEWAGGVLQASKLAYRFGLIYACNPSMNRLQNDGSGCGGAGSMHFCANAECEYTATAHCVHPEGCVGVGSSPSICCAHVVSDSGGCMRLGS